MHETLSQHNQKGELAITDLYPELDEEQLKEAETNLRVFFGVVWRIYERLKREQPELFDTPSQHP